MSQQRDDADGVAPELIADDPLGPVPADDFSDPVEPAQAPSASQTDDHVTPESTIDDSSSLDAGTISVESLLDDVEQLTAERDQLLETRMRDRAEYENTRRRLLKQNEDQVEHAAGRLVEDLLPVLDACDGAMLHGAANVEPVFAALLGALEKGGLERIDPLDEPFDPNRHDAVMHEPSEGDQDTVVVDVLRRGYAWKGRVLRPAMVKVRG